MKKINIGKYIILLVLLGIVGLASLVTERLQDKTPPVISCDTDILTVSVAADASELLAGVTAVDEADGDVTDSLVIERMSAITAEGSRSITYGAFDSSNNVAKYTRTIQYTDYMPPRFSLGGDLIYQTWNLSSALNSIHVTDCLDGDITNKVKLYSYEGNSSSPYYTLTVYVTNSSGETVNQAFKVELLSLTAEEYSKSPKLALKEYLVYVKAGEQEPDWMNYLNSLHVMGEDMVWAAIEDFGDVKLNSNVNMDEPGMYDITYTYTDDQEYTGKTRLFVIVEE